MKVGKTIKQATNKETKLSKHDKLSKPKIAGKLKNIKKLNVAKNIDGLKLKKRLKKSAEIDNTTNYPLTVRKKKKHVKHTEQKHKTKEHKNKVLNSSIFSKLSSKDAKVSANIMKDKCKMQLGCIHNFDKLNHHNYSKPAKESKHQDSYKPKKKTKMKEHNVKPKKNKLCFNHDNCLIPKVPKEKKHKCHSKLLKDSKRNSKLIKSKDHITSKHSRKMKMKQNSSKELKQSASVYNSNKSTNKSLYEQLSKMKLSSVSSSENDVPEKKRKMSVCNGTAHISEDKFKTKPNFLATSRDKVKEILPHVPIPSFSPPKSQPSLTSSTNSASRCHRIASLNAIAKVQILLENESRKPNNSEKIDDHRRKSTSLMQEDAVIKEKQKSIASKMTKKSSNKQDSNREIVPANKVNQGGKRKLEGELETSGARKSKRMASMNAQAILAATSSLKPRQRLNKTPGAKKPVSVSGTEDDMEFQVKWSSAKFHKEVGNKSNSSLSYHQSKVVITGVRSTRTLKQGHKINKKLKASGKKELKNPNEPILEENNLCSYHKLDSDEDARTIDGMSLSRVGLTKFTKVTKVQINTTEGMDMKSADDSNIHKIEQGEMAVMSTYQYQTKAGCCYDWQKMFGDPVPNHLSNQTDSNANSCSYQGSCDLISSAGSKPEGVRRCCSSNFVAPECKSSSPVSCYLERCSCQESNDSYVHRLVIPYCNHKSVCHSQPLCRSAHQTSCFPYCSGKCITPSSSVQHEAHCASTCTGQRKSYPPDQYHRLTNFQNHHEDSQNLVHRSFQQAYPNRYHSYSVHCHPTCQLHKLSCHECQIPNHVHKPHRHSSHMNSSLVHQKSLLSSHSQDVGCPPVPHSPSPPLMAPSSDSAASLAAKVPRTELLVPQEANLPTEGKLSIEDGSYKCCISCQATSCENDAKNLKCVPSCKLNCITIDSPEPICLNPTITGKQRLKSRSTSTDKELAQDIKVKNCKKTCEKLDKRYHIDNKHCNSTPKSFKILKLNKWRRSESPDDTDVLCNSIEGVVDDSMQMSKEATQQEAQKPVKKHKKDAALSKLTSKKLYINENNSLTTKAIESDDNIPVLSLIQSSIAKKLGKKRFSNGWSWEGESFHKPILLSNDDVPQLRKCYSSMRHQEGDVIKVRDCVLLKSGPRKIDLPFVAKVIALWENADDGEMMVSLLWYYRPEHTEQGRKPHHREDEIFASKHRDVNSVACIEDKCYVLTLGEYCRYRAWLRMLKEGARPRNSPVPPMEECYSRRDRLPPGRVSSEMVFYCHKVYDFRQKRILKNPT